MDVKIAYCGLYCGACKIFIDTAHNNLESLINHTKIPEEYLRCEGCRTSTDQYPHHAGVVESLIKLSEIGPNKWLKMQNQRWSCKNCNAPFHWYEKKCETCGKEVPGFKEVT